MTEKQIIQEIKKQLKETVRYFCSYGDEKRAENDLFRLSELLWCLSESEEVEDMKKRVSSAKSKIGYFANTQREERSKLFQS